MPKSCHKKFYAKKKKKGKGKKKKGKKKKKKPKELVPPTYKIPEYEDPFVVSKKVDLEVKLNEPIYPGSLFGNPFIFHVNLLISL